MPEKLIAPAWGASMRKVSSAAVPVTATFSAVPGSTLSSLAARLATVTAAATPSRVNVAVPASLIATEMAPAALPLKLTMPLLSATVNTGVLTASIVELSVDNWASESV